MIFNRFDVDAQQGATFQLQLNVQDANTNPINLNNYAAVLQIRTSYANTTLTEQLSTSNGEIQVANAGTYILTLPANRTANIYVDLCNGIPPKTVYVYDMNITSNTGITTKIIYGNINVYGAVNR